MSSAFSTPVILTDGDIGPRDLRVRRYDWRPPCAATSGRWKRSLKLRTLTTCRAREHSIRRPRARLSGASFHSF